MSEIITKSEFASRRGVSAAAVSQWIKAGRISGAALVGTGRAAMINVAEAERQLSARLDMGQQLAQASVRPTASATPPVDDPQSRYQAARAEAAEIDTARARRRDLAERGLYLVTADARDAWEGELAALVLAVDQWLPDLALSLAAQGVTVSDKKRVTLALRASWRAFRQARADLAALSRDQQPDLCAEESGNDAV